MWKSRYNKIAIPQMSLKTTSYKAALQTGYATQLGKRMAPLKILQTQGHHIRRSKGCSNISINKRHYV
jgi:hypothetical protein